MPPGLETAFEIPTETKDQHGNPVKQGTDAKTGWPLEIRHKATGMHLVLIPAGEFQMGSPDNEKDRHDDEGPVHKVRITKAFYLGKYEVTQAEWQKVMGNSPSYLKGSSNPVELVSWDECQEFTKNLNAALSSTFGGGAGGEGGQWPRFSLPTEAQWEYACRAGTTTRFSFGDQENALDEHVWYDQNSGGKTHPVGGKKPNPWGLYDMHGNVWEWCRDLWHESYAGAPEDGGAWVTGGDLTRRVLRGGSWVIIPRYLRSANRLKFAAEDRCYHGGCRLALDLK